MSKGLRWEAYVGSDFALYSHFFRWSCCLHEFVSRKTCLSLSYYFRFIHLKTSYLITAFLDFKIGNTK